MLQISRANTGITSQPAPVYVCITLLSTSGSENGKISALRR